MKFSNIAELQTFIQWAKAEGILSFSIGEVAVQFSPYPQQPDYQLPLETIDLDAEFDVPQPPRTPTGPIELEQIDPKDLFYSSGGR